MHFKDIVGQKHVKAKLQQMLAGGRFPHAVMLLGPEGSGSLPLALAVAQYLQCSNPVGGDSCGVCEACKKSSRLMHPDIHFTFPVIKPEKQKSPPVSADFIEQWRKAVAENPYLSYNDWMQEIGAENKQGNITAEECREIQHHLYLKTYEDGYKIQVIWMAEFLGNEGNRLLKLIEEPPDKTIFLLIAENSELVLNTILSRVQIVKVPAIEDEDMAQALLSRFETDEGTAQRLARIASGNFNALLGMAGGEEGQNDLVLRQWLLACWSLKQKPGDSNNATLLQWIEEFSKTGRENQKIFFRYALFFFRECLMIIALGSSQKLNENEQKFAVNLSKQLSPDAIEVLLQLFTQMHYHIERNANAKIILISNSFKIASVFAGLPVNDFSTRFETA